MTKILRLLVAVPLLIVAAALPLLVVSAQTAPPAPTISLTKVGENTGTRVVYFTIRLTNNSPIVVGEDEHGSQTAEAPGSGAFVIQDPLPANATWYILSAGIYDGDPAVPPDPLVDCVPGETTGLSCAGENIKGQHLNQSKSAFVYGYAEIVIYGIFDADCQTANNGATAYGSKFPLKFAEATASSPCPPTPTPTPTNTPIPSATPTATSTAAIPTATPTKTPVRIVPLPPNTGDSAQPEPASGNYLFAALGLGAIAFGTGAVIVAKSSRRE